MKYVSSFIIGAALGLAVLIIFNLLAMLVGKTIAGLITGLIVTTCVVLRIKHEWKRERLTKMHVPKAVLLLTKN